MFFGSGPSHVIFSYFFRLCLEFYGVFDFLRKNQSHLECLEQKNSQFLRRQSHPIRTGCWSSRRQSQPRGAKQLVDRSGTVGRWFSSRLEQEKHGIFGCFYQLFDVFICFWILLGGTIVCLCFCSSFLFVFTWSIKWSVASLSAADKSEDVVRARAGAQDYKVAPRPVWKPSGRQCYNIYIYILYICLKSSNPLFEKMAHPRFIGWCLLTVDYIKLFPCVYIYICIYTISTFGFGLSPTKVGAPQTYRKHPT